VNRQVSCVNQGLDLLSWVIAEYLLAKYLLAISFTNKKDLLVKVTNDTLLAFVGQLQFNLF